MSALLLALCSSSLAATLTVGASGDYATLEDALDAAEDGDVIELEAGTFDGGVTLSALDVTIRGAGAGSTTLIGGAPVLTATSSDLTLESLTVDGDGAQGLKVGYGALALTDVTVKDTGGAQNGGGVYAVENPVTVTRVTFSRGDVGVYNGGHLYLYTSDAVITESSFEDGLAERGGAVFVYDSELTISGSGFYDNTATLGDGTTRGGALRGEEAQVILEDVTFEGNTCEGGYGGAVSMFGGALTVTGGTFAQNESWDSYGGALVTYNADVTLTDTTFSENEARDLTSTGDAHGGAWMHLGDAPGDYTATGLTFTDNKAAGYGGAARLSGVDGLIESSTFTGNESSSGGALYITNSGDTTIASSDFSGNLAAFGGAVRYRPGDADATLELYGGELRDNVASSYGGALSAYSAGSVGVWGGRYLNNEAGSGGGMILWEIGAVTLDGATLCGNVADGGSTGDGGGALIYLSGAFGLSVTHNVIANNVSDAFGGGLLLRESGAEAEVINNHFLGNVGDNGAQAFGSLLADFRFVNNLVMGHTQGTAVETIDEPAATLSYNNLFGNDGDLDGHLDAAADGTNLAVEPLLQSYGGDCEADNYWLSAASPLIDAGDPSRLDPDASVSDIGAFGGAGASSEAWRDEDLDDAPAMWDCDDADESVHPGADETPYDGQDQDCDGADLTDVDGDGYDGGPSGDDCDDDNTAVYPGAAEVWYDGVDANCAGDDDYDQDGDGSPGGENGEDCDDLNDAVRPGADDVDGDGLDADCDGSDGPAPDTGGDTGGEDDDKEGCGGCASGGPARGLALAALGLALVTRRRR